MDPFGSRPLAIVPCDKGSSTYRVKRYRERAEELRTIAADLLSQECHDTLIRLANSYDQMAIAAGQPRN
ncbi:MAG TPA: hypothetical protein VLC74_10690 [Rhizomicrobium sp.]|nr:hypothetical protein [Rhizomicrobium sp.]